MHKQDHRLLASKQDKKHNHSPTIMRVKIVTSTKNIAPD